MKKIVLIGLLFFVASHLPAQNIDNPVFVVVENMPTYPGGDEARSKFFSDNLKYPELARKNKIEGVVYASFVINEVGEVTDVKIIRGLGFGCDEEAIRVIQLMPRWNPGKQDGKGVRVQFNMPIRFPM